MSSSVAPPRDEAELEDFGAILTESLNLPRRSDTDFMARYRTEDMRLVHRAGRVAGGLTLLPCGQFFGGRRVPTVAVNAVAIAPEARGSGAGHELLTAVMRELTESPGGPPLAVLYPATQSIYRGVGFEQAGSFTRYRMPVASIPSGPHDLAVERLPADADAAAAALAGVYDRFARRQNGFVDRTSWFWRRVVDPLNQSVTTYCVRESGQVTGYVALGRAWDVRAHPHTNLTCREILAGTPGAARRLWTLLADERSLARNVVFTGPPAAPHHLLFPEQTPEVEWQLRWMLRILDVEAALRERGYPDGVERTVALHIEDDLVERNRDTFTVDVTGGRAHVRRGDSRDAPVRISVRGLAAVYSGYLSAEQLASVGFASGDDDALAALTTIFAGPAPWLPDMF
jgi:predicted acetyltransferase